MIAEVGIGQTETVIKKDPTRKQPSADNDSIIVSLVTILCFFSGTFRMFAFDNKIGSTFRRSYIHTIGIIYSWKECIVAVTVRNTEGVITRFKVVFFYFQC